MPVWMEHIFSFGATKHIFQEHRMTNARLTLLVIKKIGKCSSTDRNGISFTRGIECVMTCSITIYRMCHDQQRHLSNVPLHSTAICWMWIELIFRSHSRSHAMLEHNNYILSLSLSLSLSLPFSNYKFIRSQNKWKCKYASHQQDMHSHQNNMLLLLILKCLSLNYVPGLRTL